MTAVDESMGTHGGHEMSEHESGAEPRGGADAHAEGHAGSGSLPPALRPTRPQLLVWSMASVLALTAGLVFSASYANLALGARDVGGIVMPPGMIMTRDTPGASMREMGAVDPNTVAFRAPVDDRGARPLLPRLEGGVKVFDLDLSVIEWNILPDKRVMAYAFNRQVPGPTIRLSVGDRVRINVTNRLPEETSVHWHGLVVPNAMDGPAYVTQPPIAPGKTFAYEFTVKQAGTYFYHSHDSPDRQEALGVYGALIVDPAPVQAVKDWDQEYTIQLQEWLLRQGYTFPVMPMEGALPNYFTINGKAYPSTDKIRMRVGERVLFRFVGSQTSFIHPMHIHGGPFTVVAVDGNPVPPAARVQKDTIDVGPGERYDVVWTAREPGVWVLHCHITHHATNNNVEVQGGGGLTMAIEVSE